MNARFRFIVVLGLLFLISLLISEILRLNTPEILVLEILPEETPFTDETTITFPLVALFTCEEMVSKFASQQAKGNLVRGYLVNDVNFTISYGPEVTTIYVDGMRMSSVLPIPNEEGELNVVYIGVSVNQTTVTFGPVNVMFCSGNLYILDQDIPTAEPMLSQPTEALPNI